MSKTGEFIGNTIEAVSYTFIPTLAVFGEIAMNNQSREENEMYRKRKSLPFELKNIIATLGLEAIRYAGTLSIFANTGDVNLAVAWFCGLGAGEWVNKKIAKAQYISAPYM